MSKFWVRFTRKNSGNEREGAGRKKMAGIGQMNPGGRGSRPCSPTGLGCPGLPWGILSLETQSSHPRTCPHSGIGVN